VEIHDLKPMEVTVEMPSNRKHLVDGKWTSDPRLYKVTVSFDLAGLVEQVGQSAIDAKGAKGILASGKITARRVG
jgi:hypothetical protein